MSAQCLSNSEAFKKYRFSYNRRKCQPSDKKIVCQGSLVANSLPPDRFFRGWYPIRDCSYRYAPRPPAGVTSIKETHFVNYRVVCDICDAPRAKGRRKKPEKIDCSLRPIKSCSSKSTKSSNSSTVIDHKTLVNSHWRQHDPHMWHEKPMIYNSDRVHKSNWFVEQVHLGIQENKKKQTYKMLDMRTDKAKAIQQVGDGQPKGCLNNDPKVPKEKSEPEVKRTSTNSARKSSGESSNENKENSQPNPEPPKEEQVTTDQS